MKLKRCVECSEKDPCVTVYHGTSVNSISSIRREGMEDQYATTSVYRAHWFGQDFGKPIILKIVTPLSKLRWTDQDHQEEHLVDLSDLRHEDGIRDEELYLFIKGKIKPCQIAFLPREKMMRKIAKAERW